jgi:AGZA family xanthine/uracil permease-like MFS transporter
MILSAIGVALIEREFVKAGLWSVVAALFSAAGIIHAYELTPGGVTSRFGLLAAPEFFVCYLLLGFLFFVVGLYARDREG